MMKSKVKEKKEKKVSEYPLLAKWEGKTQNFIVLFTEDQVGTIVWSSTSYKKLGSWNNNWTSFNESDSKWRILKPNEVVELSNK